MRRLLITVKGIVQGVGFRPFIASLAKELSIKGFVINAGSSVYIEAEGKENDLQAFKTHIKKDAPPLSDIFDITVKTDEYIGYTNFNIRQSKNRAEAVYLPQDTGVCNNCESELFDKGSRRYLYPFTNCTSCGPRFTIMKGIPYDRKNTSMERFELCDKCQGEYNNMKNVRYGCEPICCPVCGPGLYLTNKKGQKVKSNNVISLVRKLLTDGEIIAIKGMGGYHLACDATNNKAVQTLRERKKRDQKPFALMVSDLKTAKRLCKINSTEQRILEAKQKPIILLEKQDNTNLSTLIAPGNGSLGIMLPYTPLHCLIFNYPDSLTNPSALVMTSANISGEPICYKDNEAVSRLNTIADYFLIHEREILQPADDSVMRIVNKKPYLIRRSRGFVPLPILSKKGADVAVLATGGDLKNSFCIAKSGSYYLSRHIGDLEDSQTYNEFEEAVEYYKRFIDIQPKVIACDLHPDYFSTAYAKKTGLELVSVQHHHAHAVSCMLENSIDGEAIAVVFDGTGYGDDGKMWGGEFLISRYTDYTRVGHIDYTTVFGGNAVALEPWRSAISQLFGIYGADIPKVEQELLGLNAEDYNIAILALKKQINTYETSGCGRLFDAVAYLCGIKCQNSFEGQAAIEFENIARKEACGEYDVNIIYSSPFLVDTKSIITSICDDIKNKIPVPVIANKFHATIAKVIEKGCIAARDAYGINKVVLSGGVFQNMLLLKMAMKNLKDNDFKVYIHSKVPTNDGGIALGQAAIAGSKMKGQ